MAKSVHNNAIQAFENAYKSSNVMLFDNRGSLTFKDAIVELFKAHVREDETLDIEAGVDELLSAHTAKVTGEASDDQKDVIQQFDDWCGSIHNHHLQAAEGEEFPKNVVYEIINSFRRAEGKTPEETLLRLRLEGANAWKIARGNSEKPTTNFIDGNHAKDFIDACKKLNILDKFNITTHISDEIQAKSQVLSKKYYELKNQADSYFKAYSAAKNPGIKREPNWDTEASKLTFSMPEDFAVPGLNEQQLSQEANEILNVLQEIDGLIGACPVGTKDEQYGKDLLMWDWCLQALEMTSVVEIIGKVTENDYSENLQALKNIIEINDKNEKGDFPGKARAGELKECDALCQLWLQEDTHQEDGAMVLTEGGDAFMGGVSAPDISEPEDDVVKEISGEAKEEGYFEA